MVSWNRLPGLTVRNGSNSLESCFQYRVVDDEQAQLLVVKFYDKLMDLIGREGYHQVGSRLPSVLGCTYGLSVFQKEISRTQ